MRKYQLNVFGRYVWYSTLIKNAYYSFSSIFGSIVHLHIDELGDISQWRAIVAGGLAGISAALATYPLEVVETRLIAQNCKEPTYRGLLHSLSCIYRNEGLQALYRGFSLTVLGMYGLDPVNIKTKLMTF